MSDNIKKIKLKIKQNKNLPMYLFVFFSLLILFLFLMFSKANDQLVNDDLNEEEIKTNEEEIKTNEEEIEANEETVTEKDKTLKCWFPQDEIDEKDELLEKHSDENDVFYIKEYKEPPEEVIQEMNWSRCSYSYLPYINLDSEEIKNLNKELEKNYNSRYDDGYNLHYVSYKFKIFENESYLSLIYYAMYLYGTEKPAPINYYTINKETGQLLTLEEYVEEIGLELEEVYSIYLEKFDEECPECDTSKYKNSLYSFEEFKIADFFVKSDNVIDIKYKTFMAIETFAPELEIIPNK